MMTKNPYSSQSVPLTQVSPQHLTLVKKIAAHLSSKLPKHIQYEDLVQAGSIGLLQAQLRFKAEKGASFETFAGTRIRGAMLDWLRQEDLLPKTTRTEAKLVQRAIDQLRQELGHEPDDVQIASACGMSLNDYYDLCLVIDDAKVISLDDLGYDHPDEQMRDHDPLSDPHTRVMARESALALERYIAELPEKEKLIFSLYHEEELTMKEIGLVLELTEARISQLYAQAALRIKSRFKKHCQGEEF